jgi:hypothetical protein
MYINILSIACRSENILNHQKINDNYPKFVITNDQFQGNTYQGIQHVYIRDFLTMRICIRYPVYLNQYSVVVFHFSTTLLTLSHITRLFLKNLFIFAEH